MIKFQNVVTKYGKFCLNSTSLDREELSVNLKDVPPLIIKNKLFPKLPVVHAVLFHFFSPEQRKHWAGLLT